MFRRLRFLRKPIWYCFLLSLPLSPFTLLFYTLGLFEGIFLAKYQLAIYDASLEHFTSNVAGARDMDFWSVPGAPGIHDVGVAPYHIPQLRDPTNWWIKLGLKRFDISPDDGESPVNLFARLDTLYRRVRLFDDAKYWHHFVYASDKMFRMDGLFFDAWDEAFDELLRYHYRNPAVGDAGFHFLECPGNFLCDIWLTRGPALLHFTTEPAELWSEGEPMGRPEIPGYAPVTVRIIELPISNPQSLALLPGTFPSPFQQMRSLTEDRYGWQQWNVHTEFEQIFLRLQDISDEKKKEYIETYGRLITLEEWLQKMAPFPEEIDLLFSLDRILGIITSAAAFRGVELVTNMFKSFLGTGDADKWAQKKLETEAQTEGLEMTTLEDNFMAQMLRDFMDSLGDNFEEKVKDSPEGQEAIQRMWDIVRRPSPVENED